MLSDLLVREKGKAQDMCQMEGAWPRAPGDARTCLRLAVAFGTGEAQPGTWGTLELLWGMQKSCWEEWRSLWQPSELCEWLTKLNRVKLGAPHLQPMVVNWRWEDSKFQGRLVYVYLKKD